MDSNREYEPKTSEVVAAMTEDIWGATRDISSSVGSSVGKATYKTVKRMGGGIKDIAMYDVGKPVIDFCNGLKEGYNLPNFITGEEGRKLERESKSTRAGICLANTTANFLSINSAPYILPHTLRSLAVNSQREENEEGELTYGLNWLDTALNLGFIGLSLQAFAYFIALKEFKWALALPVITNTASALTLKFNSTRERLKKERGQSPLEGMLSGH